MLREEMRGWMSHYTRAAFIDTGLVEAGQYEQRARDKAESEGWIFERMQGNRRMMDMLIRGEWTPEDYLIVPPGHSIQQTGTETIIKAVPVN
ncbi:MAG: DUF1638 domain-containing protein [Anaerolineales bacterium]|nr:DUF1638 domain-containing protein [Anaerolineales bacterium]